MRWIDILSASLANLLRRKLRTALTMLGVVIGSTAIIVTISLGYGAEKTQMEALQMKSNLRIIGISPQWSGGQNDGSNRITKIDDKVLRQLQAVKHVAAITPIVQPWGLGFTFSVGKLESTIPLTVVNPAAIEMMLDLREGTFLTTRTERMEFMLSELAIMYFTDPRRQDYPDYMMIYDKLERGEDLPLPEGVNWMRDPYTITMWYDDYDEIDPSTGDPKRTEREIRGLMRGIIKASYSDYNLSYFDYSAVISIDYYRKLMRENRKLFKDNYMPDLTEYTYLMAVVDSVDNVEQVVRDLKEIGVSVSSVLDSIRQMRDQIRTMQVFMGFIGAISMFVAALSIANTMMMSIYERTREIGVMKVLGCKMSNIRMMFLCEAAYIGVIGGAIGVLLSHLLSRALNSAPWLQEIVAQFMPQSGAFQNSANTSVIPTELALWTFIFVVLVSVISGFYPAQRAMHLSSLAAIRAD